MGDTKAIKETKIFDEFYETMRVDDLKAYYGIKYVTECIK
jgi:stalled ribosome rescue protein Dom34